MHLSNICCVLLGVNRQGHLDFETWLSRLLPTFVKEGSASSGPDQALLSCRPECQAWTGALLLGTCLLYCARVSMPVCSVSMSQDFGWNKKEAGIVLSSFFWGYCLTQIVGGHLGDR